jgi:nitric oxide synthase oxygenase domain/subunit
LGNNRAFLFDRKWYPLRTTVNRAKTLSKETELTTDRALFELNSILHYIRIDEVSFVNHLPAEIDSGETLEGVRKLAAILKSLIE